MTNRKRRVTQVTVQRPRTPYTTNRAVTFTDRRKEAARRACRGNSAGRLR